MSPLRFAALCVLAWLALAGALGLAFGEEPAPLAFVVACTLANDGLVCRAVPATVEHPADRPGVTVICADIGAGEFCAVAVEAPPQ